MYVVMISAWLISGLVNMGLLLPVDNLVYLSVSVIKLYVISTELPILRQSTRSTKYKLDEDLLCTDSSERSTDTFVAPIYPGVVNIHLSACCVNTSWELSYVLAYHCIVISRSIDLH